MAVTCVGSAADLITRHFLHIIALPDQRTNVMTNSMTDTTWKLTDLHHLGITVSDIERSISFYRNVLRMELIRRRPSVKTDYVAQQTGYGGLEVSVASFRVSPTSRQTLEVVQYLNRAGEPSDQATNRPGNTHLCLLVDDLRTCYAELKEKGVRFKSEPITITSGPNEGGLVVYFFDPDGYTLELFQPPA